MTPKTELLRVSVFSAAQIQHMLDAGRITLAMALGVSQHIYLEAKLQRWQKFLGLQTDQTLTAVIVPDDWGGPNLGRRCKLTLVGDYRQETYT